MIMIMTVIKLMLRPPMKILLIVSSYLSLIMLRTPVAWSLIMLLKVTMSLRPLASPKIGILVINQRILKR